MKMLIRLSVICTLICLPCFSFAQSKPKRDTSKDRSVIVAKQQEKARKKAAAQAAEKKRKQAAEAKRRNNAKIAQTPKVASYLSVNSLTSVSKSVNSYSGSETFYVNTDGKEWSVICLPSWCKVTKYSDRFVLCYDTNTNYDDRSDWFKVKSDNQEVRVDIKQNGAPLNVTSQVNYASLQHNVKNASLSSFENYLRIDANVTIKGAKGQKCLVVALISDENNSSIKAKSDYSNYSLNTSNDVFVATEITPVTDVSQTYNVSMYLPNNAMNLWKKKNNLRCQLAVYCVKTEKYVSGANYTLPFRAKYTKGKVTTKKP